MMQLAQHIDINGVLAQRGILEAAIAAGVSLSTFRKDRQTHQGWNFPLVDPLTGAIVDFFWKNADSSGDPKYHPRGVDGNGYKLSGHPGGEWYIPNAQQTKQAIADAEGIAYVANGIPALLSFRAAGVANSVAGRAETYTPKNLLEVLRFLGISSLRFMVDNDFAGFNAAIRWRDALRGSGIDFQPMAWGYEQVDRVHVDKYGNKTPYIACADVDDKADANDLWIALAFNDNAFQQRLNTLPLLTLPAPPENTVYDDDTDEDIPEGLLEAIAHRLGVNITRTNASGFAQKNHKCEFHDDKHASAGLKVTNEGKGKSGGVNCYVCGWHNWKEVADRLGIPVPALPQRERSQKRHVDSPIGESCKQENTQRPTRSEAIQVIDQGERYFDKRGLPDWFLSGVTLAAGGRSSVAMVASRIIAAAVNGLLPVLNEPETINSATLAARLDMPRESIRKILPLLVELGFVNELIPNREDTIGINSVTNRKTRSHYQVNLNRTLIAGAVCQAIENRLYEHYFADTPAPLNDRAFLQIEADKPLHDRFKAVYEDNLNTVETARLTTKIKLELNGGKGWLGWRGLLYNSRHDVFTFTPETLPLAVADWRSEYMQALCLVNNERFNADWMRHLGTLSEGTIFNIRNRAGLVSLENIQWTSLHPLANMNRETPGMMRKVIASALADTARIQSGRVIETALHVEGLKNPIKISMFARNPETKESILWEQVEQFKHVITAVSFRVQTASIYREMTEDEMRTLSEKQEVAKQAQAEQPEPETMTDALEAEQDEPESLPYPVTDYNPAWLHRNATLFYTAITGETPSATMTTRDLIEAAILIHQGLPTEDRSGLRDAIAYQYS